MFLHFVGSPLKPPRSTVTKTLSKSQFRHPHCLLLGTFPYAQNIIHLSVSPSASRRRRDLLDFPVAFSLLAFNCCGDHGAAGTEWTPEIVVPPLLPKLAFLPMRLLAKHSQIPPFATLSPHTSPG